MSAVPNLRFPEFDGEWQDCSLSSVASMKSGKFIRAAAISEASEQGTYPCYGGNGLRGYVLKYNHDGKYVLIGRQGALCGNVLLVDGAFYATEHAVVTEARSGNDITWLKFQLDRMNLNQYSTGLAQPGLSVSNLNELRSFFPSLPEQQKIASFLSSIDKKIDLLRQKKDALELYKKGLMQKVFSQEIRFKQDDGSDFPDWQEVALGDVAKVTTGTGNREDSQEAGQYIFFDRSTDMRWSDKFEFDQEAIIVAGEGKSFPPRYFVGKFGLHQRAYAIYDFKESIAKFLFYMVFMRRNFFLKMSVGSTMPSLRMNAFTEFPISLPCLSEQQKIASVLSALDAKIQNTSSQIEQIETYKKGLLQQMFV